jgi:hypothetical protein
VPLASQRSLRVRQVDGTGVARRGRLDDACNERGAVCGWLVGWHSLRSLRCRSEREDFLPAGEKLLLEISQLRLQRPRADRLRVQCTFEQSRVIGGHRVD